MPSHLCENQNGAQLFPLLLVLTEAQFCLFLKCRHWLVVTPTKLLPLDLLPTGGEGEGEAEPCQERSWEEIVKT